MPEKPAPKQPNWVPWLLAALALLLFFSLFITPPPPGREIPYSTFKALLEERKVEEVVLRGRTVIGTLREPVTLPGERPIKRFHAFLPEVEDPELLPLLENSGAVVKVQPVSEGEGGGLLWLLLPWLLLMAFTFWLLSRMYQNLPGGDLRRFLGPPARREGQIPKVTFQDVAGQENAKREVAELVDYLRHPERFRRLGAEVPKGVLLVGPPGTGKTLLARALAGEAQVPFFAISASEFIEVFVGVGAARVRHLFEEAKKNAPSIIFIDELDSVGRTRGTGLGGGHDEREQTLNQILAEMDGITGREKVIVLAATNRPDVLDPALLRPGRFDRQVTLELPDIRDREKILALHTRKVPLAEDVDLQKIAAGTPGFSGADLKNLVNEAAIQAARENSDRVFMRHFEKARDKVLLGVERALVILPEEKHRLAVHESGHTAAAFYLPHADPIYKVTIIPRGRALGSTEQLPAIERHTYPVEYLKDRLAVMLGGRAAEKLLLGSVSSGAEDDIRQATSLARAMVARWGMDEEVGPVDLRESEEHPFLGKEIAQPRRFSEASAVAVDKAVKRLLREAEERDEALLRAHLPEIQRLIAQLEARETLHREAIEACLAPEKVKTEEVIHDGGTLG